MVKNFARRIPVDNSEDCGGKRELHPGHSTTPPIHCHFGE
jgi:hypothetical protein